MPHTLHRRASGIRTGVKICGLTEAKGFDACITHGADWVGFVFFKNSPRFVTPEQAAILSERTVGGPQRVGLFVEPDDSTVADTLRHVDLDILQVYATDTRAKQISQRFGLPVWLSRPVATRDELPITCPVERILVEPRPPKDATRPGGNAQCLDWSLLDDWSPSFDWMLAGGLTGDNVTQAIKATGAPAVDVSSGVEKAPGIKDPAAIARFIRAAHSASAA